MLPGAGGWSLPHFVAREHHEAVVGHINQVMRDRLGVDTTVLRCAFDTFDLDAKTVERVYAQENHSPKWAPPAGGRWVAREELEALPLAVPAHRPVLSDWLSETETGNVPPLRHPWARTGWFDKASAWIHAQTDRLGIRSLAPIEQVRTWNWSCILRVGTAAGRLYFKAVSSTFRHEAALTRLLADDCPGLVPQVLAIDAEQGWMLMKDFDGRSLEKIRNLARWEEAARLFAEMQIGYVHRCGELLALGCPHWRPSELSAHIPSLLADTDSMLPDQVGGVSRADIERLRARAPAFIQLCNSFDEVKVPHTLGHGDLWSGNIIVSDENTLFFDWSNGFVGHPFLDMTFFLAEVEEELPGIPHALSRLQDAYLEPWGIYGRPDRLRSTLEASAAVAWLQRAIIDHQVVMPNIEDRAKFEFDRMLPYYLNKLLGVSG